MTEAIAAVILAGGRATRLGGFDKPTVRIGGMSLLDRVATAATAAGCDPVVIVAAPGHEFPGARLVLESPPHGGPVAAIAAALPLVTTETVLLLAADLPNADVLVPALLTAPIPPSTDGLCAVDDQGRPQWLAGRYRTVAIRSAIDALPDGPHNAPVRAILRELVIVPVTTPPGATDDVDRWQDVSRARRLANADQKETTMSESPTRTLPPEALNEWAAALRAEFELTPEQLPIAAILDLARDVAVGVARPAAPFSAFAAGLAAGLSGGNPEAIAAALASTTALAADWTTDEVHS